jgi:hypothetical protein
MCDFHSIAIRLSDGAIAHVPGNSHSEAVEAAKWRENQPNREPFFVECEWDGRGKYPGLAKIVRGYDADKLPEPVAKKIERHYKSLADFMADPKKHKSMIQGAGIFSGDEYRDVALHGTAEVACPTLSRFADRLCSARFGNEAWLQIKPLLPALWAASASAEAKQKRGFYFADWACRTLVPMLCERANKPELAARLRSITQVTDRATAELARQEVRSVRDILRSAWYAAAAADAAAYAAAYAAAAKAILESAVTALKGAIALIAKAEGRAL